MFVIVEGRLQVVKTVNNAEQALAERGPGDFVGEMAVIESAPRVATLRTQSDVRVLAIDGETFKRILRERPDVSLEFRLPIFLAIDLDFQRMSATIIFACADRAE